MTGASRSASDWEKNELVEVILGRSVVGNNEDSTSQSQKIPTLSVDNILVLSPAALFPKADGNLSNYDNAVTFWQAPENRAIAGNGGVITLPEYNKQQLVQKRHSE
jgi:hypothetical protein